MPAPATTEEDARRERARTLLAGDSDPVPREVAATEQANAAADPNVEGPTQSMLDAAANNEAPAPEKGASPDSFVKAYIAANPGEAAPAPEAQRIAEAKQRLAAPDAAAPIGSDQDYGGAAPALPTAAAFPPPKQVITADAEAARRAEFPKLHPKDQQAADARLAAQGGGGQAVLVSPGGMRPNTTSVQTTQGPEVNNAQQLINSIGGNSALAAAGTTEAEQKRDTVLAGLEQQAGAGNARLGGAEQKAQQTQSTALGQVADRMSKALDAARTPIVSPAQELGEMGIGQKLAFVLAAAGGGIAGRATGQNPFLQGYNQMVDSRIATQKAQAEQQSKYAAGQENLYSVMKQGFQSDDAARAAIRLMYAQALEAKVKETALHYNIDMANPRLHQLLSQIQQQVLTNQEEVAKISGKQVRKEETQKYVPPSVAVIGGPSKGEDEARAKLYDTFQKGGLIDKKLDLDALSNVVRSSDKNGVIRQWVDAHPGHSVFDAVAAISADPGQKQFIVDLQHNMKEQFGDKGMRSEGAQQIVHSIDNPAVAQQLYNREAHDYAERAAKAIGSVPDGWGVYNRSLANEQDMLNATNSPIQPIGSEPLPSSIPEVNNPPPAPVRSSPAPTEKASHKKRDE